MFYLEKEIIKWKKKLKKFRGLEEGYIEELESHLRDEIELLKKTRKSDEEAFHLALEKIGQGKDIDSEYISESFIWSQLNTKFPLLMNYILSGIRYFKKSGVYSVINIAGFALGLACAVLILQWVKDELSYDTFHDDAEFIYRVDGQLDFRDEKQRLPFVTYQIGGIIKNEFPEVEQVTTFCGRRIMLKKGNKYYTETSCLYVDTLFFKVFSFPLIKGETERSLKEPNNLLLSKDFAEKYFGKENPVGKTISVNEKFEFTVAGVFENISNNSTLKFDILASFASLPGMGEKLDDSGRFDFFTYLKLNKKADVDKVEEKLFSVYDKYYQQSGCNFLLQPFTEIHLNEYGEGKGMQGVYIFSSIAFLIILLASINFINLSTARYTLREKEIGMRKVLGAGRINIIVQFLCETALLSTLSFIIALGIAQLALPFFGSLSGKEFEIFNNENILFLFILLLFTTVVGLVSGIYPALFISRVNPLDSLKGETIGNSRKDIKTNIKVRKVLTVCQFTITIVLIIITSVIYNQLEYMLNKDLGFDKEHVIYVPLSSQVINHYDSFKNELCTNNNFVKVTGASSVPQYFGNFTTINRWDGNEDGQKSLKVNTLHTDFDYLKFMNLELAEGRGFKNEVSADAGQSFILNEAAVAAAGITDPIGKRMKLWNISGNIIGVMKDFHYRSLKQNIDPLLFLVDKSRVRYLYVKIKSENIRGAINDLEKTWDKYSPNFPFIYNFLDEELNMLYKSEINSVQVLSLFSALAIVLSCLGLLGLAAFTAETKSKEIGIRKVLGASVTDVIKILMSEYLISVLIASVIAVPVAYYITGRWLEDFAYRDSPGIIVFAAAILITASIALITVASQSIKIAFKNPVNSIKSE